MQPLLSEDPRLQYVFGGRGQGFSTSLVHPTPVTQKSPRLTIPLEQQSRHHHTPKLEPEISLSADLHGPYVQELHVCRCVEEEEEKEEGDNPYCS